MAKIQYPSSASFLLTEDCNLACSYCLTGDTLITMKDFTQKPIKDIKIGEEILGFDEYVQEKGTQRKVRPSKVLQTFKRKDKIIELTLENGKNIQITKNHKILNNRGQSKYSWKEAGKYKVGQHVQVLPYYNQTSCNIDDTNYKIGYFVGMLLGDGSIGHYKDKQGYDAYRIRLAVKDDEIIERMKKYFNEFKIDYNVKNFFISPKHNMYKECIYAYSRQSYYLVNDIIDTNFRKNKTYEYMCGFLAGIYDSEGNISKNNGNIIRISNTNYNIIEEMCEGLKTLNIDYTIEKGKTDNEKDIWTVRILSPVKTNQNLKFIHSISPAVLRKGLINFYEKSMLTKIKIVKIEEIEKEVDVYNIGTETRTYIANNVAVHNCFEEHNKNYMNEEVAKKGIDFLCDNAKKNGDNGFHVMLFGGEPLLKPDLIKTIFDYGLQVAKENKMLFTSSIITNATIMNDEIFWLFMEYKDKVNLECQLSVDGIQKVHNMYRITKEGKGSFEIIEKNIERFKMIYRNNPSMLNVHGCLNKQSLPYLYESYTFFREQWNINNIWFMAIHEEMWNVEDITTYEDELTKIADYELAKAKEQQSLDDIKVYAPLDKCLYKGKRPNAPCGAGKNFATITSNGEVYPCHHFYFNDPKKTTKMGDIWEGVDNDLREDFLNYGSEDMSCPSTCDHNDCYRCIATNWVTNGDMLQQIRGVYCVMSKIEKKIQDKMREELIAMSLLKTEECETCSQEELDGYTFIQEWIEGNMYYARFKNEKGEYKVIDKTLTPQEIEMFTQKEKQYYENNQTEIMAKAMNLILEKVNVLEENQKNIISKLKYGTTKK